MQLSHHLDFFKKVTKTIDMKVTVLEEIIGEAEDYLVKLRFMLLRCSKDCNNRESGWILLLGTSFSL